MKARTIALSAAIVAMLALPAAASAQGPFGGPGGGPGTGHHFGPGGPDLGFWVERISDRLDLSEAQQDQIQAILDQARPAIEAAASRLEEGREEWQASHGPGDFDEGAIRSHVAAQSELQADLMVAIQSARAKIYNVLTPDQQEQLGTMRDCLGTRMGKRHGGGRRGR